MRPGRLAVPLAALAAACAPSEPGRMPRILAASPSGSGVAPVGVVVEVTFSEPVDPDGLLDGRLFALCREADLPLVVAAVEAPGGIGPAAPVVPARIALGDGGRRATLSPLGPLAPRTAHAIVVGELRSASGRLVLTPEGRRRTFAAPFETGDAPDLSPPVGRWALPPHGPAPANLRALRVDFGEPVAGALVLADPAGAPRPVAPSDEVLGLDLGAPLAPGPLRLSVAGVTDLAGNAAEPPPALEISRCADVAAPAVADDRTATEAGELWLEARTEANEMARLGAEVGLADGAACGALPGPPGTVERWGEVGACPGEDPCAPGAVRCPLAVRVEGLCPGRRLRLRVLAEDLAGGRSAPGPWREAATLPPVPRPVLTEVLADAEAPEAGGEYVEVANVGTGDADLTGFALSKRTASGAVVRCPIEPLGGPVPPGGHGLVVGGAYDGRYALPPGTVLLRCGASAPIGGLANDRAPALALEDPSGTPVSSFGVAQAALRCAGRSVERIHPLGPDASADFACARWAPGTPGACNGATPAEECPRQPW